MILTRLQSVEQRLRLLDMQGSADMAAGMISDIREGLPDCLYAHWISDLEQLERRASVARSERDAMYLASHGAMV